MINCVGAAAIGLLDKTLSAPSVTIRWLLHWHSRLELCRKQHIVELLFTENPLRYSPVGATLLQSLVEDVAAGLPQDKR